jgi:NifU-like protein involved in Fe-S cluster formation
VRETILNSLSGQKRSVCPADGSVLIASSSNFLRLLKTATRAAAEKMKGGCPQVAAEATKTPKSPLSPIERLNRAQARLEASLDAIKTVRPAVEKFLREPK